jgi:hypothetical protein
MNPAMTDRSDREDDEWVGRLISEAGAPTVTPRPEFVASLRALVRDRLTSPQWTADMDSSDAGCTDQSVYSEEDGPRLDAGDFPRNRPEHREVGARVSHVRRRRLWPLVGAAAAALLLAVGVVQWGQSFKKAESVAQAREQAMLPAARRERAGLEAEIFDALYRENERARAFPHLVEALRLDPANPALASRMTNYFNWRGAGLN